MSQPTDGPGKWVRTPSGYISPQCSIGNCGRCPDHPDSDLRPPSGPDPCTCTLCTHGQPQPAGAGR